MADTTLEKKIDTALTYLDDVTDAFERLDRALSALKSDLIKLRESK